MPLLDGPPPPPASLSSGAAAVAALPAGTHTAPPPPPPPAAPLSSFPGIVSGAAETAGSVVSGLSCPVGSARTRRPFPGAATVTTVPGVGVVAALPSAQQLTEHGQVTGEAVSAETPPAAAPAPTAPGAGAQHTPVEKQSGSPEDRACALPGRGDPSGLGDRAHPLPDEPAIEGAGPAAVKPEPSSASDSALQEYWELGMLAFDEDELARYELQGLVWKSNGLRPSLMAPPNELHSHSRLATH